MRANQEFAVPKVTSAALARTEYHDASATMLVVFRSGGAYAYHDVPRAVYERVTLAASPGRTFRALVADRYRFTRLREPLDDAA